MLLYCYYLRLYTEWAHARGDHCDPFWPSRGPNWPKRATLDEPALRSQCYTIAGDRPTAASILLLLLLLLLLLCYYTATTYGSIRNGLMPGATTATLFGPPGAPIGQKGSPQTRDRTAIATASILLLLLLLLLLLCYYTATTYGSIRNGLMPGATTATLFGPPGAPIGQKGSPFLCEFSPLYI